MTLHGFLTVKYVKVQSYNLHFWYFITHDNFGLMGIHKSVILFEFIAFDITNCVCISVISLEYNGQFSQDFYHNCICIVIVVN